MEPIIIRKKKKISMRMKREWLIIKKSRNKK